MLPKKRTTNQKSLFLTLEDMLDQKHPLYILANRVNWQEFEDAFTLYYCEDTGRPAKPIRLMAALLILKHLRKVSDENIVEQWRENVYYQYFCGEKEFLPDFPCEASELAHFRHRIGKSGIELILKESTRVNGIDSNEKDASTDTAIQKKYNNSSSENKIYRKIIDKCKKIAKREGIPIRQSYTQILKKLSVDQQFRNQSKNKLKAQNADKKVKAIAGRLVRELERNLLPNSIYLPDIEIFKRILSQKKE